MTRIGFVGHGDVGDGMTGWVSSTLQQRLDNYSDSNLQGVTCLTGDFDHIFASLILDLHGSIHVVFPARDYIAKISSAASSDVLQNIVDRASDVETMPFANDSPTARLAAYEAMLLRSEIVLAVWDGGPSSTIGDVADIVRIAHERLIPVVVLWPLEPTEAKGRELVNEAAAAAPVEEVNGIQAILAGGFSDDLVKPDGGIPREQDYLGRSIYADMLASAVARADTPLPLSIGIFGEWGTGKSSFMGLMRESVRRYSLSGNPLYASNVVQIGFNAWAYSDTNLWASLGDKIFSTLAGHDTGDDRRSVLLRAELNLTNMRSNELRQQQEKAEYETARLREGLESARLGRRRSMLEFLWAVTKDPDIKRKLDAIWGRLGVADEMEQGQMLADQVRGLEQNVKLLRKAATGRHGFIALAIGIASLFFLAASLAWAGNLRHWLAGSGLVGLGTALVATTDVARRARKGTKALNDLVATMTRESGSAERASLRRQVDDVRRAEVHEELIEAQLTQVVARAGELARELVDVTSGNNIYRFLAERAGSSDYSDKLGLISTIRGDLEQLSSLMNDWRDDPSGLLPRPVDRIVLYIDDLDRCSPQQIVGVLEAVHLLLALDLFVVVIGVDPRWLLQSLRQQYNRTMSNNDSRIGLRDAGAYDETGMFLATPQEYVEKIINIPFSLPEMTSEGFETLIRKLSGEPIDRTARGDVGKQLTIKDGTVGHGDRYSSFGRIGGGGDGDGVREPPAESQVDPTPLEDFELAFLSMLHPLVGSPRRAKRVLNIYRMLRSTHELSSASLWLGESGQGEYQAVAVLLGMVTAYPLLTIQMLFAQREVDQLTLGGICVRPSSLDSWSKTIEGLHPIRNGDRFSNDLQSVLTLRQCSQWTDMLTKCAKVNAAVTLKDLSAFKNWGPHVARFTFIPSVSSGLGAGSIISDYQRLEQ